MLTVEIPSDQNNFKIVKDQTENCKWGLLIELSFVTWGAFENQKIYVASFSLRGMLGWKMLVQNDDHKQLTNMFNLDHP